MQITPEIITQWGEAITAWKNFLRRLGIGVKKDESPFRIPLPGDVIPWVICGILTFGIAIFWIAKKYCGGGK